MIQAQSSKMHSSLLTSATFSTLLGLWLGAVASSSTTHSSLEQPCAHIFRDVAVLGGGSSGTYTAVRLTEFNKSVAVIEATHQLGGHVQTYLDPATNRTDNSALKSYYNISITRDYWNTLGVEPVVDRLRLGANPVYFDFNTGKLVADYVTPNVTAGLQLYRAALDKFPELIDGFDALPEPVPEDLLLPFGQFAEKYGFQDAIFYIAMFGQGGVDYLNAPTLYVAKYVGIQFLDAVNDGLIVPSSHDNHEIYAKAFDYLGSENIYLHSRVTSSQRSDDGVRLHVQSSNGSCTIVESKQLVVAVPHTLDNLLPLDLDETETDLFRLITGFDYYGALIRNADFPIKKTYANTGSDTKFNLGHLPNPHTITQSTIQGLIDVKYGAGYNNVSSEEAKANILESFNSVLVSLGGNYTKATEADIANFASYGPYEQHVSPEHVANGFYKKLWALQGKRSTFYTGAAWQAQDSAMIWNFTEARVLPLIL